MNGHILYKKGDVGCPPAILDRNGDVALACCRICGKGEAELTEPCKSLSAHDRSDWTYERKCRYTGELIKWLKIGDVVTHETCMGCIEEMRVESIGLCSIFGKPTNLTKKLGPYSPECSFFSVLYVNRCPVEALQFLAENSKRSFQLSLLSSDDGWDDGPLFVIVKRRLSKKEANSSGWARRLKEYRQATPPWYDKSEVKAIYKLCREMNKRDGAKTWAIDHIYPLNGGVVCGLHIAINLRIIKRKENDQKGNFVEGIHHEQLFLFEEMSNEQSY